MALEFLTCLRSSFGRHIKSIGFTGTFTSIVDDTDCGEFWIPLLSFISRRMSLNSVTMQVPRDASHAIDETKEMKRAPDPEWYEWWALGLLTASLMAGTIKQLRLSYLATLVTLDSSEDAQLKQAKDSRYKDPMDKLESISRLRYPHYWKEQERERLEDEEWRSALAEGRSHRFDSWEAFRDHQYARRERLNFVVTREDDPIGDVGTVLVLTRPTASQG